MELLEILRHRRSVRKYTEKEITEEQLKMITQAGLLYASGKGTRPCEMIVVTDKEMLMKLSKSRVMGSGMLEHASAAIVVIADTEKSTTWIEDCSIMMDNMHIMADHLGLGSCWVQLRIREAANGQTSDEYVRSLLGYPEPLQAEAMLSLGTIDAHPAPYELDKLPMEKIHYGKY